MGKCHFKNGFEYECDKYCFSGNWVVQWKIRPEGQAIFVNYQSTEAKTVLKDVVAFLTDADAAADYYYAKLARLSDVAAAERALKQAQAEFLHVSSPDFDLRSNNPDKENRRYRSAKNQLDIAEQALKTAVQYMEILRQAPPKRAMPFRSEN